MQENDLQNKIQQTKEFSDKFGKVNIALRTPVDNEIEAKNLVQRFISQLKDDVDVEGQILESYGKIPDPKSKIYNAKIKVFNIKFVVRNKEEEVSEHTVTTEITDDIVEDIINRYYRSTTPKDSIYEQLESLGG